MTLAEIEKLTDEEANQRVAELLGWKAVVINAAEEGDDDFTRLEDPDGNEVAFQWGECDSSDFPGSLPNWCADLNAAAEMERALTTKDQRNAYLNALSDQYDPMRDLDDVDSEWESTTSKPRRRVNAFLVVMLP